MYFSNIKDSSFQILALVERSNQLKHVQLVKYYQNILLSSLNHFWNSTPTALDGVLLGYSVKYCIFIRRAWIFFTGHNLNIY